MKKVLYKQAHIAILYLFIAAGLGAFLRVLFVTEIAITYRYIVHAHSHIALLGWVYLGMTTLIYHLYLNNKLIQKKYKQIFWATQITLIGMLISFPIQGYALFSIVFSTLFLIVSYVFTWFFITRTPKEYKEQFSYKCIKMGLYYMVLSSIGPWALGIIMTTLGATSIWYRLAIYFYLHFQYNGWMILGLIGVLFAVYERAGLSIHKTSFTSFFRLLNLGIIATVLLSTLWTNPPAICYFIGGTGAILQIIALYKLIVTLKLKQQLKSRLTKLQWQMLISIGVLIWIKFILQVISAIPFMAEIIASTLDFTIGYLHWTFLGVISIGLFFFLEYFKILKMPKWGWYSYVLGFVFTELLIFYKGSIQLAALPLFESYYEVLAIVSVILFLSIAYIFGYNLKQKGIRNI